jgi:anti-anti-sigma factor
MVVDLVGADDLFDERAIDELSAQLHRRVENGHTRLVLNLSSVRSMSSDVLGVLAAVSRRVAQERGRLGVCGLNPTIKDMLQICRLDRYIDVYPDEVEVSATHHTSSDR